LPGHHLPLGFWVEADMAHDSLAQQVRLDQLADSAARRCSVVGDYSEVAQLSPHQLVDDALGRAHAHEPADHQARAVGDDGNRLFSRDRSHASTLQLL
jgi:hypothetical protein